MQKLAKPPSTILRNLSMCNSNCYVILVGRTNISFGQQIFVFYVVAFNCVRYHEWAFYRKVKGFSTKYFLGENSSIEVLGNRCIHFANLEVMQQTGVVLVKQLPFCVVYECLYQIFLPVVHTIRIELISCCILRITEKRQFKMILQFQLFCLCCCTFLCVL